MSTQGTLTATVLGPTKWRAEVGATLLANVQNSELAQAVFSDLSERHVPITPNLTILISDFLDPNRPATNALWEKALARAAEAVGLASPFGQGDAKKRIGDVLLASVIEPILRRAALNLGKLVLHGRADFAGTKKDIANLNYHEYCAALESEVENLMSALDPMGRGFWAHAGIILHSANLHRIGSTRKPSLSDRLDLMPHPDAHLASLVFALEPDLGETDVLRKKITRISTRANKIRVRHRLKEGGVTGITVSRRPEDLVDALISELALPDLILTQKIAEEGFFTRDRPPRRRPKRDMLGLGFPDPDPALEQNTNSAGVYIAKAAFADATMRLSIILKQAGRPLSNFVWCEARGAGHCAANCPTQALNISQFHDAIDLKKETRRAFLMRSPFVPALFNTNPAQLSDPHDISALAAAFRNSLSASFHTAKPQKKGHTKSISPDDFTTANVFVIRPTHVLKRDQAEGPSKLRVGISTKFQLKRIETCRVHCLYLPKRIEPGAAIQFYSSHSAAPKDDFLIPNQDTHENPIDRTIGGLSAWMIEQTLDSLHG